MSELYGDLIIPDIDLYHAAEHYTADQLKIILNDLSNIANELGLADIWSGVEIIGTDGSDIYKVPEKGKIGLSTTYACSIGIGFWRDFYLDSSVSKIHIESAEDKTLSENKRKMAMYHIETARKGAAIRGPEVDAVKRVYDVAKNNFVIPLKLEVDHFGTWCYEFYEGYRRRLAYALAYEASIKVNSLFPIESLVPSLIIGKYSELVSKCLKLERWNSFSIFLNLFAILKGAYQYQIDNNTVYTGFCGEVVDYDNKMNYLHEQLQESASLRLERLNEDGCFAVEGLLKSVSEIQHYPDYIVWGKFESSKYFISNE